MERTYELLLGEGCAGLPPPPYSPGQHIRHAHCRHWLIATGCIAEQVFDGRYAYLYHYEYWIDQETVIPIRAHKGDLHLIYALATTGIIVSGIHRYELQAAQGAYLYLPIGIYEIKLQAGHHILVGFIIDAGIFRPPADRQFAFLAPLIQAKKTSENTPIIPIGFYIATTIIYYIKILFSKLNPHTLDNEYILLQHLIFLIHLTRFKLTGDSGTNDQQDLALRTHQLLRHLVVQQGAQAKVKDLSSLLGLGLRQLRQLYKARYHITLRTYRNQLLLEVINDILPQNEKLIQSAEQAGFSGISEMNRFIRKQTGLTASGLKNQLMDK
ncbi:helix-turn-helix domain-containing protein [Sphingobacterium tabacisoli]|uniref:Helix-turn-helix domain-containing protein n=1 Tax=Sphingobacterium tabacisoli TaxID=2044855 RepID=A0ABW5L2D3_9SPHI|nr:helix-turn-helix domain-containing protein [Sphingobacterium tabacisoli]